MDEFNLTLKDFRIPMDASKGGLGEGGGKDIVSIHTRPPPGPNILINQP